MFHSPASTEKWYSTLAAFLPDIKIDNGIYCWKLTIGDVIMLTHIEWVFDRFFLKVSSQFTVVFIIFLTH